MESQRQRMRVVRPAQWHELAGAAHAPHAVPEEPARETLGTMLRGLRTAAGLTQEELAERAGLSVYSISNIERGVPHRPRPDTLQILARALQLSSQQYSAVEAYAATIGKQPPPAKGRIVSIINDEPPPRDSFSSFDLSPLYGREGDIETITQLLRQPDARLISLVGPAGVGKTRLALDIVRRQQQSGEYGDGCIRVDLVPLSTTEQILAALAHAAGIPKQQGHGSLETLTNSLRGRETLILLDNVEHVMASATIFPELLAACPDLRIVVTSRSRLNVRGERVHRVEPLALPDTAALPALAELHAISSVALFVSHAQTISGTFVLTTANAHVIAQICCRLDGLPLALELAAARIALFSASDLLTQLMSPQWQLSALVGGPQDAPLRQQTLRAALQWSYNLLTQEQQKLFQTLAVFQGYPMRETILAVHRAACDANDVTDHESTYANLQALIESNLATTRAGSGETLRVGMFEMVRAFAREVAEREGSLPRIQTAHAQYYLARAEQAAERMQTFDEVVWLRRLDDDQPDLREALGWACRSDTTLGVRLAVALRIFWSVRGYAAEGLDWFAALTSARPESPAQWASAGALLRALRDNTELPGRLVARAMVTIGNLYYGMGLHVDALTLASAGLPGLTAPEDRSEAAFALNVIGNVALRQGDFPAAREAFEASLAHARQAGDEGGAGLALNNLATVAWCLHHYDDAQALYEEALAHERQVGDLRHISFSLQGLANVAYSRGDYPQTQAIYEECATIQRQLGYAPGLAHCLNALGQIAHVRGDDERATEWLRQAYEVNRQMGSEHGIAMVLSNQGDVLRAAGRQREAFEMFQESLRILHRIDEHMSLLAVLLEVASVHPEHTTAALLLGASEAACEAIEDTMSTEELAAFEQRRQHAQTALGTDAFALLFAEGRRMSFDDAVALALKRI